MKEKSEEKFILQCFEDVEEEENEWLWKPYIPLGMFVLIAGDSAVGKTYITTYLASVISNGSSFPLQDENTEKGNVILLNSEDSKSELKKRLLQANANLEKVFIVSNKKQMIKVNNIEVLEQFIKEKTPRLIIIDTLNSFIGSIDTSSDNAFRNAMFPLVELCQKYNTTLLCISHFNKSAEKSLYRVGGSVGGYIGMPRSVIYAFNSHIEEEKIFTQIKNSYGQKGKAISYQITDKGIKWLRYEENIDAEDFTSSQKFSQIQDAKDFILSTLEDKEKMLSTELETLANDNEIKTRTFQRARASLKKEKLIDAEKINGKTFWKIKTQEDENETSSVQD